VRGVEVSDFIVALPGYVDSTSASDDYVRPSNLSGYLNARII
jgi:predicted ABC-class ATPase